MEYQIHPYLISAGSYDYNIVVSPNALVTPHHFAKATSDAGKGEIGEGKIAVKKIINDDKYFYIVYASERIISQDDSQEVLKDIEGRPLNMDYGFTIENVNNISHKELNKLLEESRKYILPHLESFLKTGKNFEVIKGKTLLVEIHSDQLDSINSKDVIKLPDYIVTKKKKPVSSVRDQGSSLKSDKPITSPESTTDKQGFLAGSDEDIKVPEQTQDNRSSSSASDEPVIVPEATPEKQGVLSSPVEPAAIPELSPENSGISSMPDEPAKAATESISVNQDTSSQSTSASQDSHKKNAPNKDNTLIKLIGSAIAAIFVVDGAKNISKSTKNEDTDRNNKKINFVRVVEVAAALAGIVLIWKSSTVHHFFNNIFKGRK